MFFLPSGLLDYGSVTLNAKFDPFLSLDCAGVEGVGAQSILPSGNLERKEEIDAFFSVLWRDIL